MKRKIIIGVVLLGSAALLAVTFGGKNVAYETPDYRVVDMLGQIEVREYAPYLVAETLVDARREQAGNEGFRILAKYIFGGNQPARRIAMTAPVSQEKAVGANIAMTAPVTQAKSGEQYKIQFMMPSEYALDELPVPNDSRVSLREVPSRTFAALRYGGTWSKRNYDKHLEKLLEGLRAKGYEPVGEPVWARYNSPFTPWFLRRNEILTEFRVALARR